VNSSFASEMKAKRRGAKAKYGEAKAKRSEK
jgi:hypothetical protein